MATLPDPVKLHIVQALACFDGPTQVAESVKAEFGVTVPRQQIQAYDPTKAAGVKLAKKWRAIFEETRRKFLEDAAGIPIAQQSYRLRQLQRMVDTAMGNKNHALAAQLIEQAAKEVGGAYTDRRRIGNIPGEGPFRSTTEAPPTDDELAQIARGGGA